MITSCTTEIQAAKSLSSLTDNEKVHTYVSRGTVITLEKDGVVFKFFAVIGDTAG